MKEKNGKFQDVLKWLDILIKVFKQLELIIEIQALNV